MRDFELTMRFDGIVFNCHGIVQLVRCKDCKWYVETEDEEMNTYPTCEHPEEGGGWTSGKNWFCADGERKDEVE